MKKTGQDRGTAPRRTSAASKSKASSSARVEAPVLRFRITLAEVEPPIWRRIEVPARYTFWDLHVAIQDAMGWRDYHLHAFRVVNPDTGRAEEIGIPEDEADTQFHPGWEIPVAPYFAGPGASAAYDYDFGDGWKHEVVLEASGIEAKATRYPRCVAGERACPPEDCGGPRGYADLLDSLADPESEDHLEKAEWVGDDFDPEAFSAEDVVFDNPEKRLEIALDV